MVAHARAIGDATLERKLLRELHATAAHSEEAMPPVLSSDVDDSAIDALHEAVAATPRDPAAWLALARAHAGRRDWHEGVLASFPAVLLAEQSVHDEGATAAAAAAKRLLGRCSAMLLPKGWLPAANGSLEWAAASLERATAAAAHLTLAQALTLSLTRTSLTLTRPPPRSAAGGSTGCACAVSAWLGSGLGLGSGAPPPRRTEGQPLLAGRRPG